MDREVAGDAGLQADPFGAEPTPWYRRLVRRRREPSPRSVRVTAGVAGLLLWAAGTQLHGASGAVRYLVAAAILTLPVWIVERRHRLRRRSEEEELLPPP
jgi:hypothetical protein